MMPAGEPMWPDETRFVPPQSNIEAEQALLGALLVDNRVVERVVNIVRPVHFFQAPHGPIFEAIVQTVERGGRADPVTLKARFQDDEALAGVGGARYLVRLAHCVVTIVNAPDYARAIAECWRRREIIRIGEGMAEAARKGGDIGAAAQVIEDAERELHDVAEEAATQGGPIAAAAVADETLGEIEARYKNGGQMVGVTTGLVDLDRLLGGLKPGLLYILAGRPSMGKSALAGCMAFSAGKARVPGGVFSLEMPRAELCQRWFAGLTDIGTGRQNAAQLDDNDFNRLIGARNLIASLPLMIDDTPGLGISQIRQRARRIKRKQGLAVLFVDHLQIMAERGHENRRLELGAITRGLKSLAKELGVAVVLLSQLSRKVEERDDKRPLLSDLRETGDIEQDADVVMFVYREEYYLARSEPTQRSGETPQKFAARMDAWTQQCERAHRVAEIIVAKQRSGPIGKVRAIFDAERQRFENISREGAL